MNLHRVTGIHGLVPWMSLHPQSLRQEVLDLLFDVHSVGRSPGPVPTLGEDGEPVFDVVLDECIDEGGRVAKMHILIQQSMQ